MQSLKSHTNQLMGRHFFRVHDARLRLQGVEKVEYPPRKLTQNFKLF